MDYRIKPERKKQWFLPLVINLDSRLDRLKHTENEFRTLGMDFVRISAVKAEEVASQARYITPGALACWLSHQKAIRELLKSDFEYALIFEDDFQIKSPKNFLNLLQRERDFKNVDLIQFGFLINDYKDLVRLSFANSENLFFRTIGAIDRILFRGCLNFASRLRVRRTSGAGINWVPDDFRAGAHCYMISRNMGEEILKLNNPTFLTTDAFYESLNSGRAFKMFRSRKSLVYQIESDSSIKNWGIEPGSYVTQ